VAQYLEKENQYTAAMTAKIKPLEETLYKEMLGRIKQTDLEVPVRRGDYLYYVRTEEGKQYPIRCRQKGLMESPERGGPGSHEMEKTHKFVGDRRSGVQRRRQSAGIPVDFTGLPPVWAEVKDLRTGVTLPDTTERVTSVTWAADNKTHILTTEDAVTKRSDKLWRHVRDRRHSEPV